MKHAYDELVEIVRRLRKECPWDREQTHESIRQNLIEEAYEVIDAIDAGDSDELKKELGDLLLHVVFHAVIAEESNKFTLDEVVSLIAEKLIRRHPHIFGDTVVNGKEDVIRNWEKIKLEEGRNSVMDGVPSALPALVRALRLQEKASKVGFDWEKKDDCWEKVEEEITELKSAVERNTDQLTIEDEFGDLLFSLVNYSRFLKINPEDALRKTNQKFITRFQIIENTLREQGKDLHRSTLEEMDRIWETAKENREKGKK
jgi:tetrapyrrole methylase family protein / MazG family protein